MKYSGPMHQTAFISTKQSQRELNLLVFSGVTLRVIRKWSPSDLVLKTKDRKEAIGPDLFGPETW